MTNWLKSLVLNNILMLFHPMQNSQLEILLFWRINLE